MSVPCFSNFDLVKHFSDCTPPQHEYKADESAGDNGFTVTDNDDGSGPAAAITDDEVPIFGEEPQEIPPSNDGTPYTVDIDTTESRDDVPMAVITEDDLDNVATIVVLLDGEEYTRVSIFRKYHFFSVSIS